MRALAPREHSGNWQGGPSTRKPVEPIQCGATRDQPFVRVVTSATVANFPTTRGRAARIAHQAHILKVSGSNPLPATTLKAVVLGHCLTSESGSASMLKAAIAWTAWRNSGSRSQRHERRRFELLHHEIQGKDWDDGLLGIVFGIRAGPVRS